MSLEGGCACAAVRYRTYLRDAHTAYMSAAAPAHAALLGRPRLISALGRAVTAPLVSTAIAGTWSLYWNDLLAGATPKPALAMATAVARAGRLAAARTDAARWLTNTFMSRPEIDREARASDVA